MNNLTKLTLTLLAACPMLLGQAATRNTGAQRAQQVPQQTQQAQQQQQTPQEQNSSLLAYSSDIILSKIFTIRYRDPREVGKILKGLGSGRQGTSIEAFEMQEIKAITVKDLPQNITAMEKALSVIDIPAVETKDVELKLRLDIIWASNKEISGNPVNPFVSDVISEVSKTLNYKFFREAATITMLSNAKGDLTGTANIKYPTKDITKPANWFLNRNVFDDKTGVLSSDFMLTFDSIRVSSNIKLSHEEKIVVGTTTVGDVAMIVVISMEKAR